MKTNHEEAWIANQLALIEPCWSPNLERGRELLDARLVTRRNSRTWLVAATAIVTLCVAAGALPPTRALAQELWYRFIFNRVDVVRFDLSKLPLHSRVTTNGLEQKVQNIDEAERKGGFRPFLPPPDALSANPNITVTGPISIEQTIRVRDIESALSTMGAGDMQVPPEWDGAQLRMEIGPMVELNYPNDVRIMQVRPIELYVPSGFDLEHFAEVAFRSTGLSSWEARAMAQRFAAHPAWLLDIPPEALVNVREVSLRAGRALLIEHLDQKTGQVKRADVVYNTSERTYSVSSKSADLSVRIANALP
jgi:hypothetical protein